ncbi:hypothetical protein HZU77_001555 [Neisseriaceae bacterium TC5R-5]|nr:hypothetical protein [Neisseriaceae bacterium TC5R-5]
MPISCVVDSIADDQFTVEKVEGQPVIITSPQIVGEAGSEWEGCPIFSKNYLVDLVALSLAYQVLSIADFRQMMGKAFVYTDQRQQEREELARQMQQQHTSSAEK